MYEFVRNPEEATDGLYWYGMRLRGYSPGAQPKDGIMFWTDDSYTCMDGKYHSVIAYDHALTDREISDYDLNFIYHLEKEGLKNMKKLVNMMALCNLLSYQEYPGVKEFTSALIEAME